MSPLDRAEAAVQVSEDGWYRVSTGDLVPDAPDWTMRNFGTFNFSEGDLFIGTGTTTHVVDIAVELWSEPPPLRLSGGGGWAEVAEVSVPFMVARLRILDAEGSQALALDFDGGADDYRLRLYARYLDVQRQRHLLLLWPSPKAPRWTYQLDDDAQPIERPDRTGTETLQATMSADQLDTLRLEVEQMALLQTWAGDIDDIVEDCRQITGATEPLTATSDDVTVALTVRQWKVVLAVLEQRGPEVPEQDRARCIRQTHEVIDTQIGDRLPPGRVLGT
ncbi:hypothetical protein BZB76_1162 [Actinomadura pelletieri DSM 43383]|uniref:Uncharacterized protein n=1 Tax=Actinomadura pelletieri DSM 43383 TaxID=1120940 RepID=A0A495R033_9ACTN|nr:hypothetical protein [Actinomadura pelletieri]RKS79687.1 hypothetical protein BZB76_1162 [Actinomadura pelletieri DSM 43383]